MSSVRSDHARALRLIEQLSPVRQPAYRRLVESATSRRDREALRRTVQKIQQWPPLLERFGAVYLTERGGISG